MLRIDADAHVLETEKTWECMQGDDRTFGCETSDDLPYIMEIAGEDNLVVGTDYGHADSASELRALDGVLQNSKLISSVANKIVGANAKALYSL
jgi:hypothetical protein